MMSDKEQIEELKRQNSTLKQQLKACGDNQNICNAVLRSSVENVGKDFFNTITVKLAEWLKIECVIIGKIIDDNKIVTSPMYLDGEINYEFTYDLAGTPCDIAIRKEYCFYPERITSLFPSDKDLVDIKAEGYVGVALFDKSGEIIGILCGISRQKLVLPPKAEEILRLIAKRISAEIERAKEQELLSSTNTLLKQKNEKLDRLSNSLYETSTKLLVSENRFYTFFEKSKVPICILKGEQFIDCNHAGLEVLQIKSKSDFIKLKPWELAPEYQPNGQRSKKKSEEMISTAIEKGYCEEDWVYKDQIGTHIWFRVSVAKVLVESEEFLYVIFQNISEQKATEQALKESEKRYRSVFENTNDPVLILKNETFIDCNQATLKALKIENKSEFLNLKPWEISPEYQPDGSPSKLKSKKVAEIALEKGFNQFDWLHKNTHNEEHWYNVSLTKMEIEGETILYTIWRDINIRKQQEEQLNLLSNKLAKAQSIASVGYFEWYKDTDYVTGSEEYFRIWESNQTNHHCFKDFNDSLHPDDRDNVQKALDRGINNKEYYNVEYRIIVNNKLKYIHAIGEFEFDSEGNAVYLLGMVHDITNVKDAKQKLKIANATKDKFFSIIAHDLKGSFSSIMGLSEMLSNNLSKYDDSTKSEYIKIIKNSTKRTYQLLENLLTWSRSQLGKIEYTFEKIGLSDFITDTIQLLSSVAENKDIEILVDVNEDIFVHADKPTIDTVFRNLLSNAIKFSNRGGTIVVNTKRTNIDNIPMVEICVKDNGVGIPNEIQEQLFSIESNQSTTGTEREEGTGLGLILCKEFIENNGGEIWVKSEIDKGSEFRFSLKQFE
jgi:PAS domain S-box-containing protein